MKAWTTSTCALWILVTLVTTAARADDWPQFRGPGRDGISKETGLLRSWPESGPKVLWRTEVGQGYAGAAIRGGRVYFNDYDEKASSWLVRSLELETGKELWRFSEKKRIRPNHGITRTTPATDGERVFSIDPKCVLHALDAKTGKELWQKSFVSEYGGKIPPWYAGQCPLLDGDRLIIAPGGKVLMSALDAKTGEPIWAAPDERGLPPSHASVMPATIAGEKQYLHATLQGIVGVAAESGQERWFFERKFNMAMVPSPLVVEGDRVFVTNGYQSGSTMFRVKRTGEGFGTEEVFTLSDNVWNSEVQTPILHEGHLFAVGSKKRGLFTCLDLDGKVVWTSERQASFELGGFVLADGMFFALEGKTGKLRLIEARTDGYHELASAQLLGGHDVWAPPALSDGKLVIRDFTQMICVEVGGPAVAVRQEAR